MKNTIELPQDGMCIRELLFVIELDLIQQALSRSNYNKSHAARLLNLKRTTFLMKMNRYGLSKKFGEMITRN